MTEEFLDVKNVLGFCVFCSCFPVVAKEDMCWRFPDSYVEIGLSVVVDRGRGSTTTNANQTTEKFSKSLMQYANFWITALNYEQALKM